MAWRERKLTDGFGVELSGQLIEPALPQGERDAIYAAAMRYGVVVIPGQSLSDDALHDFAGTLGRVFAAPKVEGVPPTKVLPISNVNEAGEQLPPDDWWVRQNMANELWHVDNTFMRPRATLSFLYGREVTPVGGNTEFCDMRLAWEALPGAEQARLERLTAHHSIMHSRATYGFEEWSREEQKRFPPIPRPLVALHEESGRKSLLLASHIADIEGMARDEGAALVRELTARATVTEHCYAHRWIQGDLLLWDNRCIMHRATPFDLAKHRRDMRGLRLMDLADA
jgi:alpha-ketoglutarate-dependent 2,4-dichlorophenoxyacetate dioxygenase